jgi:hypothetical protein
MVALASAAHGAILTHADMTSISAPMPGGNGLRTMGPSLFVEDFEGFAYGSVNGQFIWDSDGTSANIVNASGISASFGTHSLQLTNPVSYAGGTFAGAPTHGHIDFDFVGTSFSTNNMSSAYAVDFYGDSGFISGRLFWFDDGGIYALGLDAMNNGVFVNTGAMWSAGSVDHYAVESVAGNTVNYYKNGALIYTGVNIVVENGATDNGFSTFRPINFGLSTAEVMYVDNIGIPAPGAAPVLALGLALGARRRR